MYMKFFNRITALFVSGMIVTGICLQGCNESAPVTRGDAAAIIAKECGFTGSASVAVSDVTESHKHYTDIMTCISRKIFGEPAMEDYRFRPDDVLTRYELAKLSVYLYAALLCVEDENIAPGGRQAIENMEDLSPEKKWYVYCAAENGFISVRDFNPGSAVDKSGLKSCLKAVRKKAGVKGTGYETYAAAKLANFRSFPIPDIPAAEILDIFTANTGDRGIKLLASTLQGLVNRDTVRLYMKFGGFDWTAFAIEKGYFSGMDTSLLTNDWGALLAKYAPYVKKAIVWDPDRTFSINFCVNIAAVEDRVLLTDSMVEMAKQIIPELHVTYFADYRIESQLEAQRYNYRNEFPHLRRDLIGWNYYNRSNEFLRDYFLQMKMLTMWVPGDNSPDYREETLPEACEILQRFPATIPMLGFGHAYDIIDGKAGNYGLDEFPAVKLHGEYGKYTAVFGPGNLSFHAPLKVDPEKKKFNRADPEPITYDSSKKYVAVTMTESGDAPGYIQNGLRQRQWDDSVRGKIPFSICYGLLNYDIHPLPTEYFASTQTQYDYMFGAISGIGYNYPLLGFGSKGVIDDDGIMYMDQETIMNDHYTKANSMSEKLNFRSLGIYSFPASKWSQDNYRDFDRWVAPNMPFIKSFVGDMHRPAKSRLSKDELYALTSSGQNIFHCSTFWRDGGRTVSDMSDVEYLAEEIVSHTTYTGELYHCMAYSWQYNPHVIKQVMEKITQLHPEYVFVMVGQLDVLQAQRK